MAVGQKLCWPILEGFQRINVGPTAGAALVKSGELKTFLIGCRRFVTEAELQRFIAKRLREAAKMPQQRARSTEKATAESLRVRAEVRGKLAKQAVAA